MSFWKLEEARLRQKRSASSAANAEILAVASPGPPAGKVWVVTAFGYLPSVAETQTIGIWKNDNSGSSFALLNPTSLALNPAVATFIEQGMEVLLYPGEYIVVGRGGHTAGSTMAAVIQFIEIDLPLYTYEEPQIVKRQKAFVSQVRETGGAALTGFRPSGGGGFAMIKPPAPKPK